MRVLENVPKTVLQTRNLFWIKIDMLRILLYLISNVSDPVIYQTQTVQTQSSRRKPAPVTRNFRGFTRSKLGRFQRRETIRILHLEKCLATDDETENISQPILAKPDLPIRNCFSRYLFPRHRVCGQRFSSKWLHHCHTCRRTRCPPLWFSAPFPLSARAYQYSNSVSSVGRLRATTMEKTKKNEMGYCSRARRYRFADTLRCHAPYTELHSARLLPAGLNGNGTERVYDGGQSNSDVTPGPRGISRTYRGSG